MSCMYKIAAIVGCTISVTATCRAQTQNYVSKFNANGGTVNSSIFDNGNIGIGTTTPGVKLDVATGPMRVYGNTDSIWNEASYYTQDTGANARTFAFGARGGAFSFSDETAGAVRLYITGSGNVGIGTSGPTTALDVNGDMTARVASGPGAGQIEMVTGHKGNGAGYLELWTDNGNTGKSHIGSWAGDVTYFQSNGGYVGIGTATPQGPLDVNGRASASSLKVASSFTDTVNNSPWYGIGMSNLTLPSAGSTSVQVAGFYGLSFQTASTQMVLTQGGNAGIGTVNPGARLEVNGSIKISAGSGGGVAFPDGSNQTTAWTGVLCGGDYAESVGVSGERAKYEPGDVIVIDPANSENFLKSSTPYATTVAGIFSTKPGAVGRRSTNPDKVRSEIPMAMVGIVPTKVSAENGPINRGDLLVTATMPGYAMKGTDRAQMLGAVVGKALEPLNSGTGFINVLVTLQ